MFRIGIVEIIVVVFMCIIIIKPEELPFFLKKISKIYGDIKKSYDDLTKMKDEFVKMADAEVDLLEDKEKKKKLS